MELGFLPAAGRRAIAVVSVLAVATVASISGVRAQQAPAQAPPPDQFKFDVPSLLLFLQVQPGGVEAFATAMDKVKDALKKSEKPERKAQASHWKVFRSPAQANGVVIFIWQLDQVSKDVTYNPFTIMGEGGMDSKDVKELYDKIGPALPAGSITMIPLTLVTDMGGM